MPRRRTPPPPPQYAARPESPTPTARSPAPGTCTLPRAGKLTGMRKGNQLQPLVRKNDPRRSGAAARQAHGRRRHAEPTPQPSSSARTQQGTCFGKVDGGIVGTVEGRVWRREGVRHARQRAGRQWDRGLFCRSGAGVWSTCRPDGSDKTFLPELRERVSSPPIHILRRWRGARR